MEYVKLTLENYEKLTKELDELRSAFTDKKILVLDTSLSPYGRCEKNVYYTESEIIKSLKEEIENMVEKHSSHISKLHKAYTDKIKILTSTEANRKKSWKFWKWI